MSDDAFNGLTALKSLSLSGNPLFPLSTLYKLNSLTSLQIHYNSYRTLSPDPFEQLASLYYIYADNPFLCDCSLRWTSLVSQYSLSIQSAYCLEPSKVYRTAIISQSLYTNCAADKSYNCFSKSISCPIELVCRNTANSYACTCADGFSLSHTGQCYDEDECQLGLANCEYQCNNTVGSYECYCNTGYQLSSDDRTCEDVDECALGAKQCLNGEICDNTIGSFACRETDCVISCQKGKPCTCCNGYRFDYNSRCVDIDECHTNNGGCQGTCINTEGGYSCNQTTIDNYLLAFLVISLIAGFILAILIFFLLVLLIRQRRKRRYEGIPHPLQNEYEGIYDIPIEDFTGNEPLIEKLSTNDDSINNSLEIYPLPIAEVQYAN